MTTEGRGEGMDTVASPAPWSVNVHEVLNVGKRRNYSTVSGTRSIHAISGGIRIVETQDGVATVLVAVPNRETRSWECEVWAFETFTKDPDSLRLAAEILISTEPPTGTKVLYKPYDNVAHTDHPFRVNRYGSALLTLDSFIILVQEQRSNFMARQAYHEFRSRHGIT